MVAALNAQARPSDHVVSQVVKAKLRVCAVSDIRLVRGLLEVESHTVLEQTHAETHEAINLSHPLAIALGKVIVDGHDVYALAFKGIEVTGERRHQGLAFACFHLGNGAAMQGDAADNLHVKVTHPRCAARRLPYRSKCLGEKVVERLAVLDMLPEELRLAA